MFEMWAVLVWLVAEHVEEGGGTEQYDLWGFLLYVLSVLSLSCSKLPAYDLWPLCEDRTTHYFKYLYLEHEGIGTQIL